MDAATVETERCSLLATLALRAARLRLLSRRSFRRLLDRPLLKVAPSLSSTTNTTVRYAYVRSPPHAVILKDGRIKNVESIEGRLEKRRKRRKLRTEMI